MHGGALFFLFFVSATYGITIQDQVEAALAKGYDHVVVPPGVYPSMPGAYNVHLNLTNVQNFALFAYGATLLCEARARALDVTGSVNVSIVGLTIDYNPLTFTQGTIVNVTSDILDLKIHAGYPEVMWNRINVIDPATGFMKDGMGFMWDISVSMVHPGVVRVSRPNSEGFYTASIGDYATLAGGPDGSYACHGIAINFCTNTTLVNVTIYAAPGFGLAEWGGEGGLTLTNFSIIPGPTPDGATEPRLQTTSWDAIEHTCLRRGPSVRGATILLAGDDSWSAVGDTWQIAGIDRQQNTMELGGDPSTLFAGDGLRLRDPVQYPNELVLVVKMDREPEDPQTMHKAYCSRCAAKARRQKLSAPSFTVLVDREIPVAWNIGDTIFSPDRQVSGFALVESYVRSKGRGALVKAPNGTIQYNHFEGGTAGVEVSPEMSGVNASYAAVASNLLIANNTIVHTGYHETFDAAYYGADGAVALFSFSESGVLRPGTDSGFRNITIRGNTFRLVNGLNIGIAAANGVEITDNIFEQTHPIQYSVQGQSFGFDNGYVLFLTDSNNITLARNYVYGNGPYKKGDVFVSNSTQDIIGEAGGVIQINSTSKKYK